MTIIKELEKLNQEIVDASLFYNASKTALKEEEAKLFLYEDLSEVVGKKPTQKDKEHYIYLKTLKLRETVEDNKRNLDKLLRAYEIKKLECKFMGNFLNTLAGVTGDDD